ncbi:hypothetical protein BB561_003910 [Smittium simulii]|uniref:RNA polymerase III subunit Rpc25 domain-containing protein n=1 Tax=Smittium simulii TaxID=133385 RepID=A0A2T9YJ12_9FUNG|nr:hypothetical protein BB561_003910 [Smittium simulii]
MNNCIIYSISKTKSLQSSLANIPKLVAQGPKLLSLAIVAFLSNLLPPTRVAFIFPNFSLQHSLLSLQSFTSNTQDNIRVRPWNFGKERIVAITDEINKKYANKVIHNVGLVIRLFDIVKMNQGYVQPSEGSMWVKGEIIDAKIQSCTHTGIKASCQFFSDIWIPRELLREGTEFNSVEGVFVWRYEDQDFFLDLDEPVRLRVVEGTFIDSNPPRPTVAAKSGANSMNSAAESNFGSVTNPNQSQSRLNTSMEPALVDNNINDQTAYSPPYFLTCTMAEDGLGPISWW